MSPDSPDSTVDLIVELGHKVVSLESLPAPGSTVIMSFTWASFKKTMEVSSFLCSSLAIHKVAALWLEVREALNSVNASSSTLAASSFLVSVYTINTELTILPQKPVLGQRRQLPGVL